MMTTALQQSLTLTLQTTRADHEVRKEQQQYNHTTPSLTMQVNPKSRWRGSTVIRRNMIVHPAWKEGPREERLRRRLVPPRLHASPGFFFFVLQMVWFRASIGVSGFVLVADPCPGAVVTVSLSSRQSVSDDDQPVVVVPSVVVMDDGTASTTPTDGIQNFRPAAGLPDGIVYRCASTDVLADKLKQLEKEMVVPPTPSPTGKASHPSPADTTILNEGGLIFDLRSPMERNEDQAQYWMNHPTLNQAPVCVVEVGRDDSMETFQQLLSTTTRLPKYTRFVFRINVLDQPLFVKYCDETWLKPVDSAKLFWYQLVDGQRLHEWRMEELNQRGLAGLNQAILETGQAHLCKALQIMTLYQEAVGVPNRSQPTNDKKVIIHCVQGKDRTGMLVMLLQSLLGVPDVTIIDDYFQSNENLQKSSQSENKSCAAASTSATAKSSGRGKLDRTIFSGTNRQAMIDTLAFLRERYGSVSPGYLDAIGFDETWRRRLIAVLR